MSEGIYLFGTDLRLGDNPLLQLASRECDRLALVALAAAAHSHGVAEAAPARSLSLWQPWLAAAGRGG